MDKETLDDYIALDGQFKKQCERVSDELSRLDRDEYGFCDYFYLSDDGTYVIGDEYLASDGCGHHSCTFQVELLTYSDKQLKQYVDGKIEEREAERQKAREAENQIKTEHELAELARLKDKYEPKKLKATEMEDCQTGQTVTFMFKGTECTGEIVSVSDDGTCTVSFVYRPGDGRAPESVIYSISSNSILR